MSDQAIIWGLVVLVWAAVAYRLPALYHDRRNSAARAYWLTMASLGAGLTLLLDPVYLAVDRASGIPNLATLLKHSFALIAAWMVQTFFLHVNYSGDAGRRIHRRGWALAAALALMAVLFRLAPVDQETLDFTGRYAQAPFIREYWLVFLAYLGFALVNLTYLPWRYAGLSDKVSLRIGFRLWAAGGALGLVYVVHKATYIALRALGVSYPAEVRRVSDALVAGAVAFIIVGSTMPAWGPRVGLPRLCRWLDDYRAHWRLYPLWRALYDCNPDIALLPASSALANALTVRQVGFRLYRRVVEIRDGLLALREYLDPQVAKAASQRGRAAGLADDDLQALVEAESVAAALRAKQQGLPPAGTGHSFKPIGGKDLSTEVSYLQKVACYYRATARRQSLTPLGIRLVAERRP